jgi:hypothetical protein
VGPGQTADMYAEKLRDGRAEGAGGRLLEALKQGRVVSVVVLVVLINISCASRQRSIVVPCVPRDGAVARPHRIGRGIGGNNRHDNVNCIATPLKPRVLTGRLRIAEHCGLAFNSTMSRSWRFLKTVGQRASQSKEIPRRNIETTTTLL